jgi:hypothetical protein
MIEADVSTLEAASAAAPSDAKSDSLLTTREVSGAIESGREHSRILLAAYHFPPSAAVGGLRVTRFARFLPEFGWRPFVLTVEDADRGGDEGTDVSRLAGLEALQITRTRRRSGLSNLYRRIRRSVSRSGEQPAMTQRPPGPRTPDAKHSRGECGGTQRLFSCCFLT